ncbi:unnamed protein product [Triticum turgidum subsp. durum]|uniref:Uncharacterized protein n=1 Tax=Triticum turgidum subsp. durum TaxID=4567 RepID=A0A9R0ZVU6_TRITD|nr:unnamed protein product [Triticum turgidum subsp. durum]
MEGVHQIGLGEKAWWPRCGSPMLCSDGPPLWFSLVRFPVVACVEPWVRLSFALSLLLLSLALLLLVRPASYQSAYACCLGLYDFFCHCRSTHQGCVCLFPVLYLFWRLWVARCALPSLSYLCVVAEDGSVLAGVNSSSQWDRYGPMEKLDEQAEVSSCGKAETSSPTVEEKDDDNDQAQVTRNKRMKWQA